jgi:hypothetical protein
MCLQRRRNNESAGEALSLFRTQLPTRSDTHPTDSGPPPVPHPWCSPPTRQRQEAVIAFVCGRGPVVPAVGESVESPPAVDYPPATPAFVRRRVGQITAVFMSANS